MDYQKQLDFLKKKHDAGQLAHAYIFVASDMSALQKMASELVGHIGCKFPDVISISSVQSESSVKNEKDMMEISVEQIRQAQQFLSYKSYYGGYKMLIIENAERMTAEAQNCFLKNLEEPKGKTLIMLFSANADMLLPTISSRCQTIKLPISESVKQEISKELARIISAPLAEKFQYAKQANLEGDNFVIILDTLQKHFRVMMLAAIGIGNSLVGSYSMPKITKALRLIESMRHQSMVANVNAKLALEILLMEI